MSEDAVCGLLIVFVDECLEIAEVRLEVLEDGLEAEVVRVFDGAGFCRV